MPRLSIEKRVAKDLRERPVKCLFYGNKLNDKARFQCTVCGNIWETTLNSVIRGTGCRACSSRKAGVRRRLSHEKVVLQITQRLDVTVLGAYKGDARPLQVLCNVCGHVWSAKPTHLKRNTGCPECNKHCGGDGLMQIAKGTQRLKRQKTWLYVYRVSECVSKVGITNDPQQRLREFRSKHDFDCLWEFDTREETVIAEWLVLNNTKHFATNQVIKGGGNSELRSLPAQELVDECQLVIDAADENGYICLLRDTRKLDSRTIRNIEKQLASA